MFLLPEITLLVFSVLNIKDILNLSETNKYHYYIYKNNEQYLYKKLLEKRRLFIHSKDCEYKESFKKSWFPRFKKKILMNTTDSDSRQEFFIGKNDKVFITYKNNEVKFYKQSINGEFEYNYEDDIDCCNGLLDYKINDTFLYIDYYTLYDGTRIHALVPIDCFRHREYVIESVPYKLLENREYIKYDSVYSHTVNMETNTIKMNDKEETFETFIDFINYISLTCGMNEVF